MSEDFGNNPVPPPTGEVEWLRRLEAIGDAEGAFFHLGSAHAALMCKAGPVLLVSFETVYGVRSAQPDEMPLGFQLAQENGWSSLSVLARSPTWFRDRSVYAFFDRLEADGLFDEFAHIVFYGAGMCGYAALAFSVAAPGSTVVALAPQATLDARLAGWDERFLAARRSSFTDRYGFAPDMAQAAKEVFIAFDPHEPMDAMHAAMFTGSFVKPLPCAYLGPDIAGALNHMGLVAKVLKLACDGVLTPRQFWRLYRARRDFPPYLKRLALRLNDQGRDWLGAVLCRAMADRLDDPAIKAQWQKLDAALQDAQTPLPPRRKPG